MKLIVGLGNPGAEYDFSPHNMGFAVVDRLAERNAVRLARRQSQSLCGRFQRGGDDVWLIKPQTFMNLSGAAVKSWLEKQGCGPQQLLVIYDEIDLPWGSVRIRQKGGAAGHHGLESIIGSIGTQEFARLRIGIAPDHPIQDTIKYLLTPVRKSQRRGTEEIVDRASEAVETILKEGLATAMNRFNKRAAGADSSPVSAEGKN